MPDVALNAATTASVDEAWGFVKDMDNWAPLLMGYQSHEKIDETESVWRVKGELGGLTRIAEFKVLITEWNGPARVRFELEGLDEPVRGSGAFLISKAAAAVDAQAEPTQSRSWFAWLRDGIARRLLALVFGRQRATRPDADGSSNVAHAPSLTELKFELSLHAGGGTGPIMNVLLAPLLPAVAQDFAERIVAQLDSGAAAAAAG